MAHGWELETAHRIHVPLRPPVSEKEAFRMSLDSRIRELSERHKKVDQALSAEMKHPANDALRIYELKRQKLKLKDEIAQLRQA